LGVLADVRETPAARMAVHRLDARAAAVRRLLGILGLRVLRRRLARLRLRETTSLRVDLLAALDVGLRGLELGEDQIHLLLLVRGQFAAIGVCASHDFLRLDVQLDQALAKRLDRLAVRVDSKSGRTNLHLCYSYQGFSPPSAPTKKAPQPAKVGKRLFDRTKSC